LVRSFRVSVVAITFRELLPFRVGIRGYYYWKNGPAMWQEDSVKKIWVFSSWDPQVMRC
jgi:hypothetical protein